MVYVILPETYKRAKELGVKIFPSDKKSKKIAVFDYNGVFITYIGDARFLDFHYYNALEKQGLLPEGYANERKRLYAIRHGREPEKLGDEYLGSAAFYAKELLWT